MRKIFATLMMIAMMAVVIPFTATATNAQTRYRDRNYDSRRYERPNVYQRHRNLFNIAIGTGAGALLGGLIGGKKGALIGTAAGAGGSALYTYKINPKDRRYNRNYRRY